MQIPILQGSYHILYSFVYVDWAVLDYCSYIRAYQPTLNRHPGRHLLSNVYDNILRTRLRMINPDVTHQSQSTHTPPQLWRRLQWIAENLGNLLFCAVNKSLAMKYGLLLLIYNSYSYFLHPMCNVWGVYLRFNWKTTYWRWQTVHTKIGFIRCYHIMILHLPAASTQNIWRWQTVHKICFIRS